MLVSDPFVTIGCSGTNRIVPSSLVRFSSSKIPWQLRIQSFVKVKYLVIE